MKIENDKVVQFNYKMFETDKDLIEESDYSVPMTYLHGHNNILKGLEAAMEGHQAGDQLSVSLAPKDAYGDVRDNAKQRVPVKHLQGKAKKWKKGMIAVVDTEKGQQQVTVVKIGKFMATVDFNHPFAGKQLTFDINIATVREATLTEISHGHVHAEDGHCH